MPNLPAFGIIGIKALLVWEMVPTRVTWELSCGVATSEIFNRGSIAKCHISKNIHVEAS